MYHEEELGNIHFYGLQFKMQHVNINLMNKNILIGVVVVIVLALLGWALYKYSPSSEMSTSELASSTNTQTETGTVTPTPPGASLPNSTNTFPALFNQAGSHECKYEQVGSNTRSTNSIFIADGKMRGEFRTTTNGVSTANLMVYNNGTLYVWQEGKPTGTKTILKSVADLPTAIPKDLTSGAVLGSGLNSVGWDCHDWIKKTSLLAPPSYVKFY